MLGAGSVSMTYFRGLLSLDTKFEDALERIRDADTSYLSKAIPIQEVVNSDIDSIKAFFAEIKVQGRFAVRCKRRGTHDFSSKDVEIAVGNAIVDERAEVNLKHPDTLLWVDIIQEQAHLSVLSSEDIVKKTPKVKRRWKKGERPISRAELKIRELMSKYPELFKEGGTAIDIGAAPGGWTRAMASRMGNVIAVDRAELDEGVKSLGNVVHIKERAENLKIDEKADVITNDANLLPMQSAKISLDLAEKYLKEGGTLIHTVKFGTVPDTGKLAAKSLNHAAREVKEAFEKAGIKTQMRKLKYNTRNEMTLVGSK